MKKQTIYYIASFIVLLLAAGTLVFLNAKNIHSKMSPKITKPATTVTESKPQISPQDLEPLPKNPKTPGHFVKVPILMYHHIATTTPIGDPVQYDLTVPTNEFETQVKWFKDNGYTAITLEQFFQYTQKQFSLPTKPVIFSFDDGYADALENAVPILHKYGFAGDFAIITGYVGGTSGTNTYATWQQIETARAAGMEIICHTQNHFDGSDSKYSADYIFQNLSGCQKDLHDHLGEALPILVYPYGHYTPQYITEAKKAGFQMALTVHQGSLINLDNLMIIPRIRIHPHEEMQLFEKMVKE